jgi:hypothetical protein
MKIFFLVFVFILVAGSVYADYRWRTWVAARRQERDRNPDLRA